MGRDRLRAIPPPSAAAVDDAPREAGILLESQKMEAVGVLAGGVAHDFNNMLTVIRGHAEFLRGHLAAGDPDVRRTEAILATVDRAAALTAQLLTVGCRQPQQPQALVLDDVLAAAHDTLARLAGDTIRVARATGASRRHIWADRGQIEQLLANLVVNACDAMPKGGVITIETADARLDADLACRFAAEAGTYVTIAVRDEGIGMDEDVRAHLFEPFFTTKLMGRGRGLGLSAVYGIVKQTGGFIDVQSAPGLGTTVMIYLPEFDVATDGTGAVPRAHTVASDLPGRTILIAEDEDDVRDLVSDFLESQGYHVMAGPDGAAALQQAKDFNGSIDLLLTDVVMPVMGGPELADQLVNAHPETRVLFMTGFAPDGLAATFDSRAPLLRKPFSLDALGSAVRESLTH